MHILDYCCRKLAEWVKDLPFWYEDTYMYAHANFKRNKYFRYIRKAIRMALDDYGIKHPVKRQWLSNVLYQAMVDVLYYGEDAKEVWYGRINQIMQLDLPE